MAGAEHLLISKAIQEAKLQPLIDAGIKPHHLSGDWGDVLEWVLSYYREHGAVPTERSFHSQWAHIRVLDAADEPFSRLIEEIYTNYQHGGLIEALAEASTAVRGDAPPVDVMAGLHKKLQDLATETARIRDVNLIAEWAADLERYEILRKQVNVLRGIPTGFSGLDHITAGLRPQQLITFVGEPKKGKSLIALIMAMAAHRHGKRPQYISFEMSVEEQKARFHALAAGIAYDKILRADLTDAEMERLVKAQRLHKNMHEFHMTEDTASMTTVGALTGKIQQWRPDVLFVDGVYLMDDEQGEPKGSPQALTNITRSLKRVAQRYDIPIVITTQVLAWKLNSKTTRKVTSDAIGYSSSFAQDSDLVLAVEANPDEADQSIIRVVMARAAPHGEVRIKWDWEHMDFSEIRHDRDDDDDDDQDDLVW